MLEQGPKRLLAALIFGVAMLSSPSVLAQDTSLVSALTPIAMRELATPSVSDWSPTSNTLLIVTPEQILTRWNPFTDEAKAMYDASEFSAFSYSPDEALIALLSPATFRVLDAQTGASIASGQGAPVGFLEWSPDSTRIAVRGTSDFYTLDILDARSGERIGVYRFFPDALTAAGATILQASWGPRDQIAVVGSGGEFALLDLQRGVITEMPTCCPATTSDFDWQPNGQLLAMNDRVYDVETQQSVFLFPVQNEISWSPDGQWLAGVTLDAVSIISIPDQRVVAYVPSSTLQDHGIYDADWSFDARFLAILSGTVQFGESGAVYRDFVSVWDVEPILEASGVTMPTNVP